MLIFNTWAPILDSLDWDGTKANSWWIVKFVKQLSSIMALEPWVSGLKFGTVAEVACRCCSHVRWSDAGNVTKILAETIWQYETKGFHPFLSKVANSGLFLQLQLSSAQIQAGQTMSYLSLQVCLASGLPPSNEPWQFICKILITYFLKTS